MILLQDTWDALYRYNNMLQWRMTFGELEQDMSRWSEAAKRQMARNLWCK